MNSDKIVYFKQKLRYFLLYFSRFKIYLDFDRQTFYPKFFRAENGFSFVSVSNFSAHLF